MPLFLPSPAAPELQRNLLLFAAYLGATEAATLLSKQAGGCRKEQAASALTTI